jgi:hypothetical protein
MRYAGELELDVEPQRGDGRLTEADVRDQVAVTPGDLVRIRFLDCEDFEAAACSYLARALTGSVVTFGFARCAPRFKPEWEQLYDAFAGTYLAVEVGRIAAR